MKFNFCIFLIISTFFFTCSKVESDELNKKNIQSPLKIGLTKIYNNFIYNGYDTTCTIDTVTIIGKYKDYFIEETKHGAWTGLSLIKYYDYKYIVSGIINNNDTTFFEYPTVMGFLDGRTGYINKEMLIKENSIKCKDSLIIKIIPVFNILGKLDTIYSHYYTSTCPAVSHRYDYYSKEYGLVYNKAIERGKNRIVQEIILEKVFNANK